jgi:predicted RNA binding protein YcfA (HicA-like mRNA interferase family)
MVVGQRGSHIFLTDGKRKLTVPRHDPIKRGTLLSIIQQAGLTREEFLELIKE